MFKFTKQKKRMMEQRTCHLEVLGVALRMYKETSNEFYLDFFKWLGKITAKQKLDIENNNFKENSYDD